MLGDSGVTLYDAHAAFIDRTRSRSAGQRVTAGNIVIATGGTPVIHPAIDGMEHGITSDQAFHLPALPRRVLMVGGGYIAMEFAGIFAGLGAEVDVVFRQHLPLRGFDQDLRECLAEGMEANGIQLAPQPDRARSRAGRRCSAGSR